LYIIKIIIIEGKGVFLLSVVIPAYNEGLMIKKSADVISDILNKENIIHELIFVDDGSKDDTWSEIKQVSKISKNIKGIHFSRNFGKESAILAGLAETRGDCCVVIDCDLQHPPKTIVEMYRLWEEGYEVVEGRKRSRGKENCLYTWFSKLFYSLMSSSTKIDMSTASDFKLLDRKAIDVLINMPEKNVFFRALSSWIGFSSTYVEFDVAEREAGESKWSPVSLIKYAINNITSYSTAPMQIVTVLGVIMLLISLVLGSVAVVQKIIGYALDGFTTVILLLLFSSSITMISLGIIGYYIAKIYDEVRGRPKFIVSERTWSDSHEKFDQKIF
jgi:dolichol-phosphate mannosyltransferase